MKVFLFALLLTSTVFGATYKGKNIDGKKYPASVKIGKAIESISVEFQGETAFLYFPKNKIIEVKLHSETIDDLSAVEAFDGKQDWIINVLDLR